jgi:DoxX-like family
MNSLQQPKTSVEAVSKGQLWTGRVLGGIAVLFLTMDTAFKLIASSDMAAQATEQLGYPARLLPVIGWIEALLLVLYLVPRTSVFGALLWTGYLGGAVATHFRIGNPLFTHQLFPIYIATLLWLGLWLRDRRLRVVLPLS